MAQPSRNVEINIASIPVEGFGGMCMVVVSLICAAALPATRWFMLAAIVAGIVFGGGLIFLRRGGQPSRPTHGGPPLAGERSSALRECRRAPTDQPDPRSSRLLAEVGVSG